MIGPPLVAVPAAAAVALAGGMTYATVVPACRWWGPLISRGPKSSDAIALTFDDGPTAGCTDRVLDCLREANVPAAFFVVGQNVEQNPDLLRRIHDEGHLIGNHSFHHSHYTVFHRWRYWLAEIQQTDAAIERVLGFRPRLFRPPMGVKTIDTTLARRRSGHTMVTWSRRAIDGLPTSPQRILQRLSGSTGGDILLLHDGVEPHARHSDRTATIEAIGLLIEMLRGKGLRFERLDRLLGIEGYHTS